MPFLTSPAILKQVPKRNKFKLCTNELFYDSKTGKTYMAWRGFITDNYTWIGSTRWDVRVAHIHDVACQYHQLLFIDQFNYQKLQKYLITAPSGEVYCKDIPLCMLSIENVNKHQANELFERMMKEANCPAIPKIVQILYRIGVALNLKWPFTGKSGIDLDTLYT